MKYLFYSVVAICITVVLILLIQMYGIINVLLGIFALLWLIAKILTS